MEPGGLTMAAPTAILLAQLGENVPSGAETVEGSWISEDDETIERFGNLGGGGGWLGRAT